MIAHNTESARGIAPRAAHRSGRESLDSSGSCHPAKAAAFRQGKEFLRLPVDSNSTWMTCPLRSVGITPLLHYYETVRPCPADRYFRPRGASACAFSLNTAGRFSSSVPEPGIESRHLCTGHHMASMQVSAMLLPRAEGTLRFRCRQLIRFDAFSVVHLRSSLHSSHDVMYSRLLTMTFTTTAFDRSSSWLFEACSYKPASKGQPSSPVQHHAPTSAFLTQALRGYGTPMPAEAPRRLVTTGVYAYVANPMQIGKLTMLTAWGLFWGNRWLLLVAFFGLLYSLLIAWPREDRAMAARFSSDWHNYRRHVRRWFPRWRPYHTSRLANPTSQPARLYLAPSCPPCPQPAEWLRRHRPAGLEILPLNESDPAGARVTYDPADGSPLEFGISALARALEHINLAFAFFAWMVRLPVIASLAQAVAATLDPRTTACPIRPTFGAAHHPP